MSQEINLVAFGSSIIEGVIGIPDPGQRWDGRLLQQLQNQFPDFHIRLFNRGIGGESTREMMARFERDVLSLNPDFCIVMFEANNCDYTRPERLVPLDELTRLLTRFRLELPAKTRVISVILGPIINQLHFSCQHPAFAEIFKDVGGMDQLQEIERQFVRQFAKNAQWPVCDLHHLMSEHAETCLLDDGIHLNQHGNQLFANDMERILVPAIRRFSSHQTTPEASATELTTGERVISRPQAG